MGSGISSFKQAAAKSDKIEQAQKQRKHQAETCQSRSRPPEIVKPPIQFEGLLRNVWFHINLYWCRRGCEGQQELTKQSFHFLVDESGREYFSMTNDNRPLGVHKLAILGDPGAVSRGDGQLIRTTGFSAKVYNKLGRAPGHFLLPNQLQKRLNSFLLIGQKNSCSG